MTVSSAGTLGIDFGTSNSAMAWATPDGTARLIPLEGSATTLPTAVFFNAEDNTTHFGRDAVTHYLQGTDGRLMRSLKSLLGSPLLLEKTQVNHQDVSYQQIIETFLAALRERATLNLGAAPTRVVMGRPVHFVDDDPARDAQAQAALHAAAKAVGFEDVSFQLEPIAAALDYERRLTQGSTVLVVDIGGGTSDFSVLRLGPDRLHQSDRRGDVLASTGVHTGGTDFDQQLSLQQVMPLLGFKHQGPQQREVPSRLFFDLSTWHLINWLYQRRTISQAQDLRSNYQDTRLHDRLMTVLSERLGHHVLHDVEQGKIQCSSSNTAVEMDLRYVEPGLAAPMAVADMQTHLAHLLTRSVACAQDCLRQAGVAPNKLDAIYLTGGSSALRPFQQALQGQFPGVPLVEGDLFGGVASGLAYS